MNSDEEGEGIIEVKITGLDHNCWEEEERAMSRYSYVRVVEYPEDDGLYKMDTDEEEEQVDPISEKSRLLVPTRLAREAMEEYKPDDGMEMDDEDDEGTKAQVFLTSVLEYLMAEVVETAGNMARDNGKEIVESTDVRMALDDLEFVPYASKAESEAEPSPSAEVETASITSVLPAYIRQNCIPPPLFVPAQMIGIKDYRQQPIRMDMYWRAIERKPGGNIDTFTIRYRLEYIEAQRQPH